MSSLRPESGSEQRNDHRAVAPWVPAAGPCVFDELPHLDVSQGPTTRVFDLRLSDASEHRVAVRVMDVLLRQKAREGP